MVRVDDVVPPVNRSSTGAAAAETTAHQSATPAAIERRMTKLIMPAMMTASENNVNAAGSGTVQQAALGHGRGDAVWPQKRKQSPKEHRTDDFA